MQNKIHCSELLKLIPEELLTKLSTETKVDYQVKKMHGKTMFQLLMLSLLENERISQRVIEETYNSRAFKALIGCPSHRTTTRHSTISSRLSTINPEFFAKIFQHVHQMGQEMLKEKELNGVNIQKVDSTLVSLSSKLLQIGMRTGGKKTKKQIKFTVGLTNKLPSDVQVFTQPVEASEDIALKKGILHSHEKENIQAHRIVVFDRGIQSRKTFCEFTKKNISFISRLKENSNYKVIRKYKQVQGRKSSTLRLKQDLVVQLKGTQNVWIDQEFRLITAESLDTGKNLTFITNIYDLNAREITDIYRKRWDIEVFFRFLKQELNLNHLVSRTENGMKVMVYMILITAILLLIYKKKRYQEL